MKVSELEGKTKKDLAELAEEKKAIIRQRRFQISVGNLKNVKEMAKLKKDVARILTILNSK
ncbi:MAG: 50S ribosomal protein L29 [bacterium]